MHRILSRSIALTALTLAAGLLSGCSAAAEQGPAPPRVSEESSAAFSMSDLMFAQMMIPHHEQAVDMAELALDRSDDADIRQLSEQIRDAQQPEIEQMSSWLNAAGMTQMAHDMGMHGMVDDDDMAELSAATGAEFDRLFLEAMIVHHEGAIEMTRMIIDSNNSEVRALAESIISSQSAEIELMRTLLSR